EWERAARGGLEGAPTSWGPHVPAGEIPEGALDAPWRVGQGTPNAYGLLDMGTVVHEWCADEYRSDAYAPAPRSACDRAGEIILRRSSRGGSWRHRVRF